MRIGLIGVGVVGGTLRKYFEEKTNHELKLYDPAKGLNDSLEGIDACFISVPVTPSGFGQNLEILTEAVEIAKTHTNFVFIRSTVLPGTNNKLGTFSMPEFLTERTAYEEMLRLPIIVGGNKHACSLAEEIFPDKQIIRMTENEAELAKFTHNVFGAMKVTYFNLIKSMCEHFGADFDTVKVGAFSTGFIEKTHTQVPGPDGHFGYGGKCFPENVQALLGMLVGTSGFTMEECNFIKSMKDLNNMYRHTGTQRIQQVHDLQAQ